VDAERNRVSAPLALLGPFGDAVQFIFHEREAPTGGVKIGGHHLWHLLSNHLQVSGVAVAIACAVAIPVSLWLGHLGRGEVVASSVANVGRAIPSLALLALFVAFLGIGFTNVTAALTLLLALFVAFLGIGFTNVTAALTLLAIPPILTNTYVGVRQVDRDAVDAARGMGMSGWRIVTRVELPMALPLIFGGIRTSAVNVVATATIAPLAGYLTLGDTILAPQIYGGAGQLGGAIMVAALAVLTEVVFAALQRAVTPRGLRLSPTAGRLRRRGTLLPTKRRIEVTP
jgi:osmoprotectant transport system permease protein